MLELGTVVERYRVEAVVASGGMATVYRVRHLQLGSEHALKVLDLPNAALKERLLQEGQVQAKLNHPNLVKVTDVLPVQDAFGLVMEFVNGPTLEQWIEGGAGTVEQTARIYKGILSAVGYAHRKGLVHRDLKPQNVLLEDQDGEWVPKVLDFGIAKLLQDQKAGSLTRTGWGMGTPEYMAPEQLKAAKDVDARADMWALGCILYAMYAGRSPFAREDLLQTFAALGTGEHQALESVRPDVPAAVSRAVAACLQVRRDARVGDCTKLSLILNTASFAPQSDPTDEVFVTSEVPPPKPAGVTPSSWPTPAEPFRPSNVSDAGAGPTMSADMLAEGIADVEVTEGEPSLSTGGLQGAAATASTMGTAGAETAGAETAGAETAGAAQIKAATAPALREASSVRLSTLPPRPAQGTLEINPTRDTPKRAPRSGSGPWLLYFGIGGFGLTCAGGLTAAFVALAVNPGAFGDTGTDVGYPLAEAPPRMDTGRMAAASPPQAATNPQAGTPSRTGQSAKGAGARTPSVGARADEAVNRCISALHAADPTAAGTWDVQFTISSKGAPTALTVAARGAEVPGFRRCLFGAFENLRFPSQQSGQSVSTSVTVSPLADRGPELERVDELPVELPVELPLELATEMIEAPVEPAPSEQEVAAMIRRVLGSHNSELEQCYQDRVVRVPTLAGTWVLELTVEPDGRPGDVVVRPNGEGDAALEACIKQTAQRWRFSEIAEPTPAQKTITFSTGVAPTGSARLVITGDADDAWLRGDRVYRSGSVPSGDYTWFATFGGEEVAGSTVRLDAGESVTLDCQAAFQLCKVR